MSSGDLAYLLLGQSELSEQIMRALELKGDLPQRLFAGFDPSITALDLTEMPYRYLRRQLSFAQVHNIGPVAAQFPRVQFAIFQNTGRVLVQLRKAYISNPGAAALSVQFAVQSVGGFATNQRFGWGTDDRVTPTQSGVVMTSETNVATTLSTATAGIRQVFVPPGSTVVVEPNIILTNKVSPSGVINSVLFEGGTVNTQMIIACEWDERSVQTSETL